jgi:hypothetical protein
MAWDVVLALVLMPEYDASDDVPGKIRTTDKENLAVPRLC